LPLILFVFLFLLSGCSPTKSKKKALVNYGGQATNISAQRNLWLRGPIQAADPDNPTLTARDSLNGLPRQRNTLFDLSSLTGALSGPRLKVFYSEAGDGGAGRSSPSLAYYTSSTEIPWNTKEFRSFMVYSHGSKAIRYMKQLYPGLVFAVRDAPVAPMEAYSSVPDSPLNTRYRVNSSGKPGNVMFYLDPESSVPYDPADEADAIYHEFGHALQHMLNPDVLESFGNYDIDTLLEAQADFFAASAVRDDQILLYLKSNAPLIFSSINRNGINHDRTMGGDLHFPNDYVGEIHLDARIVSNALNDFRKFIQGLPVNLYQNCGSACTISWTGAQNYFAANTSADDQLALKAQAFDKANFISFQAFRDLVPLSTLMHFSERLIEQTKVQDWSAQCGTNTTCKNQVVSAMRSILKSRGIFTSNPIRCNGSTCTDFGVNGNDPELNLNFDLSLFFSSFQSPGKLDPCEKIFVYPNVSLRSNVLATAYDIRFELEAVTGFTSLNDIDSLEENDPLFDNTQDELKLWGFLLPGEAIQDLVGSSDKGRFYLPHQGSFLSLSLSLPTLSNSNRPAMGWALRAPESGEGTITFAFSARPFEFRYAEEHRSYYEVTQSLKVDGTNNYCSQ
jgi:hypothetical protein